MSVPTDRRPALNDLHLRSGRWIDGTRPDEVIATEAFCRAHGLGPGDRVTAVINGRRRTLVIVGGEGGGRWLGGFQRSLGAMLLSMFVSQRLRGLIAIDRADDLRVLTDLIESGKVRPAVDRTFELSEAGEAVRYLHQSRARGKVVITV